jgi:hypothetical protein
MRRLAIGAQVRNLPHIRNRPVLFCSKDSDAVFPDASLLVAGVILLRTAARNGVRNLREWPATCTRAGCSRPVSNLASPGHLFFR